MLKSLGLALAIAFSSLTANAQSWFSVQAQVTVTTSQVTAQVYNQWATPIHCRGYAYGRTSSGYNGNSWMNVVIYPGQYAYVYVNANNPYMDPLVNGWANINCRWY